MEKTQILHEIQKELQSVIKNILQLSNSVGNIITAFEKLAEVDSSKGTGEKRPPARKKVIIKDGVVEKIKIIPATQIVYNIIKNSVRGVDTTALMKVTGFNQRKIHNITFNLKKQGRIKSGERGMYKKV